MGHFSWQGSWLARGVILVLIVGVVAALYGLVKGGSLDALAHTKFRFVPILLAGLVVQVGFDLWNPDWLSETEGLVVVIASQVLVALWLALNRHLPGMWLAAAGLALNVVVIVANGAMPVSREAAEIAGFDELASLRVKHEVLGPDTVFPWIADVIPFPGVEEVLSVGDLVLAAGIGWLVYRRTLDETDEPERTTPSKVSG